MGFLFFCLKWRYIFLHFFLVKFWLILVYNRILNILKVLIRIEITIQLFLNFTIVLNEILNWAFKSSFNWFSVRLSIYLSTLLYSIIHIRLHLLSTTGRLSVDRIELLKLIYLSKCCVLVHQMLFFKFIILKLGLE